MTNRITRNFTQPSVRFILEADLLSQSIEDNTSTIRCYLRSVNTGNSSSFYGGSGYQAGFLNGVEFGRKSGNPFLPSGYANGAQRWRIGPFDVVVPHDDDGTIDPIQLRMRCNYGSIDDSATASLTVPSIPRGPRVKVDGVWRPSVAYVRVDGVWRVAVPYVRVGGVWRVGAS